MFSTDYPYQYRPGVGPRRFLDKVSLDVAARMGFGHGNWDRLTARPILDPQARPPVAAVANFRPGDRQAGLPSPVRAMVAMDAVMSTVTAMPSAVTSPPPSHGSSVAVTSVTALAADAVVTVALNGALVGW